MGMAWFTQDTIDFFAEIAENNNREWFEANKKRYENSVKKPMLAFAGEMIERMRELDSGIMMLPREAVFRLHRDTRFSKNRAPYKTNGGISISSGGKRSHTTPGLYFHIDGQRVAVASGVYMPDTAQIAAIRRHIADNLDEFAALLDSPAFKEHFGTLHGGVNKVLPADLREAAAKQPLIFNKQFFYWAERPASDALREDLADYAMELMRAGWPMGQFLARAFV